MRILHFSWEYPPVMYGGLGAHVAALTKAQVRLGHVVTVITQVPAGEVETVEECDGVRVIRVANHYPDARLTQENFDHWVHGFSLASQDACGLLQEDPEIVHGHDWIAADQLLSVAKVFSIPSVLTVHATEFGRHNGWLTSQLSQMVYAHERRAVQSVDSVIVCSRYMTNEIRNGYGVEPRSFHVIPNAVTPLASRPAKEKTNPENMTVGYIGRLEWEKGVHHIIDALHLVKDERVHLEIVGSGSQLANLEKKVVRKGLSDRVSFLGHVEGHDRFNVLQSWNMAVIPSSYEPFGIVALELGQAGIPIITSQVGGLTDIISSTEFGYPILDISGAVIASEIEFIMGNESDAQKRAGRLRERVATEFTWERVVDLSDRVYESCL
jgi:glycogen(starch) synthase